MRGKGKTEREDGEERRGRESEKDGKTERWGEKVREGGDERRGRESEKDGEGGEERRGRESK